jgi:putative sterol carrier protein
LADKSARQLIEEMPELFRGERAGRANVVVQFEISGEGGGNWYVTIRDKRCTVTEGVAESVDATVRVNADDYVALSTGKLGSMKAFTTGRVKASGDISLLQRMERWFVRR